MKVAVFDIKCTDWCNDTITITGIQFLYNKEKWNEENILESITKIQNFLNVWQMSRLTLEGRIIVFITFANSKKFFLSLISKVPREIFKWARKNTTLLCGLLNHRQKIKPYDPTLRMVVWKTLIYKKNNESSMLLGEKIVRPFFPWMESNLVEILKKSFGSHFEFDSNILSDISCSNDFPSFCRDIFRNWKTFFSANPETPSCILSQYFWFNKLIMVDNSLVVLNCCFKSWRTLKSKYHLDNNLYFQ